MAFEYSTLLLARRCSPRKDSRHQLGRFAEATLQLHLAFAQSDLILYAGPATSPRTGARCRLTFRSTRPPRLTPILVEP